MSLPGLRPDRELDSVEAVLKYRKFGPLEFECSILGLGAEGLIALGSASVHSDPKASIELVHFAIEQGVNYIDLGYPYDPRRHDQMVALFAKALAGEYRKKVKIAVTLPSHQLHSKSDFDAYLNRQLDLLKVERADFCLLGRPRQLAVIAEN